MTISSEPHSQTNENQGEHPKEMCHSPSAFCSLFIRCSWHSVFASHVSVFIAGTVALSGMLLGRWQ